MGPHVGSLRPRGKGECGEGASGVCLLPRAFLRTPLPSLALEDGVGGWVLCPARTCSDSVSPAATSAGSR